MPYAVGLGLPWTIYWYRFVGTWYTVYLDHIFSKLEQIIMVEYDRT